MAKTQNWKVNSTTIENGRVKVWGGGKYVKDGVNLFTTFNKDNFSGRVPLDPDSADPIVRTTFYSVDSNGYIDYYRKRPNGTFKKYESIQEIADAGILGYNKRTTNLLKSNVQGKLTASAFNVPGAADPDSNVNNDGDTGDDGLDADKKGDDGDGKLENPLNFSIEGPANTPSGKYRYPLALGTAAAKNLDRIRFTQGAYKGVSLPNTGFGFGKREFAVYSDSSVTLGIQPQISDSNSVKWNGSDLNAIRAEAAKVSLQVMGSKNPDEIGKAIEGAGTRIRDALKDEDLGAAKAVNAYLAGKAVGVGGALLSRVNGAILNPNLELLFEGPDLRQFNYTFKMSAESATEAFYIKSIIKWFKKGMAVRKDDQGLFMNTPNIFKIQYIKGENESSNHDGLNRIKECALLNVQTNYTPEGNYSTFEDGSMTMYDLTLSFGELTPIIASDYADSGMVGY